MSSKEIKRLLENQIKQMEIHHAGKMSGGKTPKWLKSVGHALGSVAKKSLPVLEKIGSKVADKLVEKGINYALGGRINKNGQEDLRTTRAQIVKDYRELHPEKTFIEASRDVKELKLFVSKADKAKGIEQVSMKSKKNKKSKKSKIDEE